MKKIVNCLIFLILPLLSTTAQEGVLQVENITENTQEKKNVSGLRMLGKVTNNIHTLRWAPLSSAEWQLGNSDGYRLEYIEIRKGEKLRSFSDITFSTVIKPWELDEWKIFADSDIDLPLVAAQAIHGSKSQESESNSFFVQDESNHNKYSMALLAADFSADCAKASGLSYSHQIKNGFDYYYRLALNKKVSGIISDTAYHKMQISQPYRYAPIISKCIEEELSVTINIQENIQKETGYYVEKSEDGKLFSRINDLPYIYTKSNLSGEEMSIAIRDSVSKNYTPHYYRVQGIDAFADLGPYSETILLMGRDKTPTSPPRNLTSKQVGNSNIELTWNWSAEKNESDLQGFKIFHGSDPNGYFEPLQEDALDPSIRSFVHTNTNILQPNYYFVAAIDTASNIEKSLRISGHLIDTQPPSPPKNLSSSMDSTGYMLLKWAANPEPDVTSYQVYFSNDENAVFTNRSYDYVRDTLFLDSLNLKTLTEEIFYYVIAVDASFNESARSEIIKVQKPDIVPPTAPIIKDYKNYNNAIRLTISPSRSSDVVNHSIWRKTDNSAWKLLTTIATDITEYIDTPLVENESYNYRLSATDDSNNKSPYSQSLRLKVSGPFYLIPPANLTIESKNDQCVLTWDYNYSSNISFMVYRKTDNGKLISYKLIDSETTFTDTDTKKGSNYTYAVKAIRTDGKESKLSELIKIEI